ncbi:variable surface protein [Plasmodium gonderi]|uniref:Variable surface protein n=1 Tax=Plasmodium gonderi TaxID=77519 RepID=A0A1Y1JPQ1_PLAGO|nr:variable surface protein [Plasmodium gonderi]GAW84451.1 variable surface protein [Plasmodium gonderi]
MTTGSQLSQKSPPVEQEEPPRIDFEDHPSTIYYKGLKEDTDSYDYSEYYSGLSDLTNQYSWLTDIFKKLSRNISMINNEYDPKKEFDKKHCFDLNYWLHDEVFKNLESSEKVRKLTTIVPKILEAWKSIVDGKFSDKEHKCYPDFKLYNNMAYLQEVKDLFDFFEDYETMKKEIIQDTYKACDKYHEYLDQRIPVYYTWRDSCTVDDYACKRYIDKYMKYRPATISLQLSPWITLFYSSYPCLNKVYRVFVRAKEKIKRNDSLYKELMEKIGREELEKSLVSAKADDAAPGSALYMNSNNDSLILYYTWKRIVFVYEKIFPHVLLFLGIILLFYIFFKVSIKFTPFGRSILRTRAKFRKKFRPYIDYEDILLLSDSDESLSSSSSDGSYSVSYSSQ